MLLPGGNVTRSLMLPVPLAWLSEAPPDASLVQVTLVRLVGITSDTSALVAVAVPVLLTTMV